MSVLKIKNAQGEWQEVPFIKGDKGDKGDTYELTEQDKQDIADLVEVPESFEIHICSSEEYDSTTRIPTITNPDEKTFYLVPSEDGTSPDLFVEWAYVNNAWEMFGSASIDLSNYVTNTDYATANNGGVVRVNGYGLKINASNGIIQTSGATSGIIKSATGSDAEYRPVTPLRQHESTFYGLAKASGDSTQSASYNAVGTYTDEAKASIQNMLGVPSVDDIPDVPVEDVQINGTSILGNGVANVPIGGTNLGVVKINSTYGIKSVSSGTLAIQGATAEQVKNPTGTNIDYKPLVAPQTSRIAFYGFAKAAGHDEKDSTLAVGNYTPEAKGAIQSMLGIDSLIAPTETNPFTNAHAIGDLFIINGTLYRAKTAIAIGDVLDDGVNVESVSVDDVAVKDVQINGASILQDGVANVPLGGSNTFGVFKAGGSYGIGATQSHELYVASASTANIKSGTNVYKPIVPSNQDASTFYGLAKAAGHDEKDSELPVGQYTVEAKSAIQDMLDVPSKNDIPVVNVDDVQINGTSILQDGVANMPIADSSTLGVIRTSSGYGLNVNASGIAYVSSASDGNIKTGTDTYRPIVSNNQHASVFYGLAKASGDTTQSQSSNAVGTYTDEAKSSIQTMLGVPSSDDVVSDVQVNGTSVVTNGVASIPIATIPTSGTDAGNLGLTCFKRGRGLALNANDHSILIDYPTPAQVKSGNDTFKPVTTAQQHAATFYGLAKASGDTTQSQSSNPVGTYTDEAKQSIKQMLGVVDSYDSLVVNVTGTDPVITAQPSYRYNCGEVTTLTITPPSSGTIDIIFTSGTTPTVLDLPSTVKMPSWWIGTEANTTYEMCITDGVYCGVMSWDA